MSEINVTPVEKPEKIKLDIKDLRVDKFRKGGTKPLYMKVTHIPTQITVDASAFSRQKLAFEIEKKLIKELEYFQDKKEIVKVWKAGGAGGIET